MALNKTLILIAMSALMSSCGNTTEIAAESHTSESVVPVEATSVDSYPTMAEPEKGDKMISEPSTGDDANYARNDNIAIEEEFQDAEIKGTVAGYEMFIARHSDHELSKLAKIRIREIQAK